MSFEVQIPKKNLKIFAKALQAAAKVKKHNVYVLEMKKKYHSKEEIQNWKNKEKFLLVCFVFCFFADFIVFSFFALLFAFFTLFRSERN